MTVQADLVAGARLLTENATLQAQLKTAQRAAANSADAAQILGNRVRNTAQYLMTVPDATPIEELRRDLQALLAGNMH